MDYVVLVLMVQLIAIGNGYEIWTALDKMVPRLPPDPAPLLKTICWTRRVGSVLIVLNAASVVYRCLQARVPQPPMYWSWIAIMGLVGFIIMAAYISIWSREAIVRMIDGLDRKGKHPPKTP